MTENLSAAPPTQHEVAELIEYSKRNFLRKAQRNMIRDLGRQRDELVLLVSQYKADHEARSSHDDASRSLIDKLEADLTQARQELQGARAHIEYLTEGWNNVLD